MPRTWRYSSRACEVVRICSDINDDRRKTYKVSGNSSVGPVLLQSSEEHLALDELGDKLEAVGTVGAALLVQASGSRGVGAGKESVEVGTRDHVRNVLGKGRHEGIGSVMQRTIGLLGLDALLETAKSLGNGNRQDGDNGVLENIHEGGEAEKSHDAELPRRLAKTAVASNGSSGSSDGIEILLAVLLGDLVDAVDGGVLVAHVVGLADNSGKLGQESKQSLPRLGVVGALVVDAKFQSAEDLLAQNNVRTVKKSLNTLDEFSNREQVEVVGKRVPAEVVKLVALGLDRARKREDALQKLGVELADLDGLHIVLLGQSGNLLLQTTVGKQLGKESKLLLSKLHNILRRAGINLAEQSSREDRLGLEDVADDIQMLDEGLQLNLHREVADDLSSERNHVVSSTILVHEHGKDSEEEVLRSKVLDKSNKQILLAVRRNVLVGNDEAGKKLGGAGNQVPPALAEGLDQRRNDLLNGLVDHVSGVVISLLEDRATHEGEDGHNTVQDNVGRGASQAGNQQEGSVNDRGAGRTLDAGGEDITVTSGGVNGELLAVLVGRNHGKQTAEDQALEVTQLRANHSTEVLELRKGGEETGKQLRMLLRLGLLDELKNEGGLVEAGADIGRALGVDALVRRTNTSALGSRLLSSLLDVIVQRLKEVKENIGGKLNLVQNVSGLGSHSAGFGSRSVDALRKGEQSAGGGELGLGLHGRPNLLDAAEERLDEAVAGNSIGIIDELKDQLETSLVVGNNDIDESVVDRSLIHGFAGKELLSLNLGQAGPPLQQRKEQISPGGTGDALDLVESLEESQLDSNKGCSDNVAGKELENGESVRVGQVLLVTILGLVQSIGEGSQDVVFVKEGLLERRNEDGV